MFATQDFGTKLATIGSVMEETGLTLLDLKSAKMLTGTEDGMTVRKFLMSGKPLQLMDLSKLHMKVSMLSPCSEQGAILVL